MAIPVLTKYNDIEKCEHLVHEKSCYGWISYCNLNSWSREAPCRDEVKEECLRCHHSTA